MKLLNKFKNHICRDRRPRLSVNNLLLISVALLFSIFLTGCEPSQPVKKENISSETQIVVSTPEASSENSSVVTEFPIIENEEIDATSGVDVNNDITTNSEPENVISSNEESSTENIVSNNNIGEWDEN